MKHAFARSAVGLAVGGLAFWLTPALRSESARTDAVAVMTGGRFVYTVKAGDSLTLVSARFGVDLAFLVALNRLDPNTRLRVGQTLLVDNRHLIPEVPDGRPTAIVINIPQRLLFHTDTTGAVSVYPVGLGRPGWPTFAGPFRVASLETNPVWDVPPSIQEEMRRSGMPVLTRVPPGPANPLGRFWIGLDRPGYGIHGTNAPASIYRFQTHGCIRLHPADVARLFPAITIGTSGQIVYEPILLTRAPDATIWLEAHPDVYRRVRDALAAVRELASREEVEADIDWQVVGKVLHMRHGTPVDVTLRQVR
jgi:L,D-transpeptidase ErfK/SrfK